MISETDMKMMIKQGEKSKSVKTFRVVTTMIVTDTAKFDHANRGGQYAEPSKIYTSQAVNSMGSKTIRDARIRMETGSANYWGYSTISYIVYEMGEAVVVESGSVV